MSANRKLQAEIDKVLKKVDEGVEIFDDIWEKVYAAEVQALKDKYEGELKKEIKKLQRLRDQIKTWAGSNDIKDKSALIEARKLIESKMEQFKVCEKETKTKAYSKEGLAREEKLDPREQDRLNKQEWAQGCIDNLTELNETLDAEVDKITSGKAKAKAKGEAIERLENRMMTNRWHIEKLEQIIKVLEADLLDPALIDDIKDDVEYFLETAVEDDGAAAPDESEFDIYEELQLDSLKPAAPVVASALAAAATEEVSTEDVAKEEGSEDKTSAEKTDIDATLKIGAKGKTPVKAATAASIIGIATGVKQPAPKAAAGTATATATAGAAAAKAVPAGKQVAPVKAVVPEKPAEKKQPAPAVDYKKASIKGPEPVKEVKNEPAGPWAGAAKAASIVAPAQAAEKPVVQTAPSLSGDKPVSAVNTQVAPAVTIQQGQNAPVVAAQVSPVTGPSPAQPPAVGQSQNQSAPKPQSNPEANSAVNRALKMSMFFTAPGAENDNRPTYAPRNPGPTHPLFPTQPAPIVESAALYENLPMDSLFLAFYYQQGSYHQYLAAKQLKKHSWRFHKKYMTWFQRHEEPKLTTDEYEEGTYVYFDYESGWCQRIKSEFKFEYCYLEDEM